MVASFLCDLLKEGWRNSCSIDYGPKGHFNELKNEDNTERGHAFEEIKCMASKVKRQVGLNQTKSFCVAKEITESKGNLGNERKSNYIPDKGLTSKIYKELL